MLALCPSRLLTPTGWETGRCLLIEEGKIAGVCSADECPAETSREDLDGDLVPGFIDLQVNGGGGILFNETPTVEGIRAIGRAHRKFGTTGFLPTVISDDLEVVDRAMRAVEAAMAEGVSGLLGIHIEGPFINREKRGIHDAGKIRKIDEAAVELLTSLRSGATLVTLAPEAVPQGMIARLVDGGVVVALGHTNGSYEDVRRGLDEGAAGFTHLFNAMSQMSARAPGAVGAALESGSWCGIIADGFHVYPAALRVALAAKGSDRLVLVTDAMPPVGSDMKTFMLGGRTIHVEDGRCMADDGTLAGSALDMARAVANAVAMMGVKLETAVNMASANPARAIGVQELTGAIRKGLRADLALLGTDGVVKRSWIAGLEV